MIVDDGAEPARGSIYPRSRNLENTVQFVPIGVCVSWVMFSGSVDSRPCFALLNLCVIMTLPQLYLPGMDACVTKRGIS